MSSSGYRDAFNGKLQTVADLEKAANDLEKNLTNLNKSFLRKLFKGFASLTNVLEGNEPGIFSTVIKWYRLYLKVQISIDPDDEKFFNYFEKTIPTAITYIIGCLQHKTKELPNYHYSLLEIIEQLLENVKPNIFNRIINLETGTIACLWNPIDYAGDYNTQLKALQILSLFLKHLDNDKQNEELKSIKWTNLNLFQEKLKTIIQESKLATVFDTTARELLNNYNMNLSKNVRVYSFHCQSLTLGTKYKFYKPLNLEKFWIDINYCPQTLSFNGRFKLNSKSKYEQINVILKIKNIKMDKQQLLINYRKPGEFSKYCQEISAVSENFIQLTLNYEEEQRLRENHFVMDYFNSNNINDNENPPLRRTSDVFQKSYNLLIGSSPTEMTPEQNKDNKRDATSSDFDNLKNKQTKPSSPKVAIEWVESPKSSRIPSDTVEKKPIRKMPYRKRKFFSSLLEEEGFESEEETKKASKRKSRVKKPRQPKITKKQVCKVSPIVDLTGTDDNPNKGNVQTSRSSIQHITNDLNDGNEKCIPSSDILTTQQCSTILKTVSDIYNVGDTTYAEPCQSYRNFKTQQVPETVKSSLDKKPAKSRVRKPKKETSNVENITADKENIDPNILKSVQNVKGKQALSNHKSMISPNIFGTPINDEKIPSKRPRPSIDKTVYTLDMDIDLTGDDPLDPEIQPLNPKPIDNDICTIHQLSKSSSYENILNDDLLDYEDVRIDENPIVNPTAISTPNITKLYSSNNASPTSAMNISDINDSDMELTQLTTESNYIMDKFQNKKLSPKKQKLTVVDQILNDWNFDDNESIQKPNEKEVENKESNTLTFDDNESIQKPNEKEVQNKESNTLEEVNNNNDADDVLRQCVVFQKRLDDDESDCSDNDDIDECVERHPSIDFLKQPDFMMNEDFVIMQNMSSNINPFCNNLDNIWNTPDKNNMIVRNVSTKSSTECQVTPNTLILRQIQVSTKESVLIADLKHKHQPPYCKAKKSLKGFYNNRSICGNHQSSIKDTPKHIDPANKDEHLDNNNNIICPYEKPPKRTYLALKPKAKPIETNNSLVPLNLNNLNIRNGNHINKAAVETIVNANGTGKDLILLQNNNSIVNKRSHCNKRLTLEMKDKQQNVENCGNTFKPSSILKTITLQEDINTIENINLDNSFHYRNSISYDEPGTLDRTDNYSNEIEEIADKRSCRYNNNYSAENIENLNNSNSFDNVISLFSDENHAINRNADKSAHSENNQDFFKNELSQLEHDYNAKMEQRIENARRLCLTNTADLYQHKILEITESVLRKSEEQKKELELLRKNIESLVTRMEWQYQIFINKSKLYDNYKEITERSLNALTELNVQQRIQTEYQELAKQLKIDQNEVLQEVWQNYIEQKKKDYLNKIDNLTKI